MYKRLLYIEDLYEFYSKNFDDKSVHFSYKDKGCIFHLSSASFPEIQST